MGGTQTVWPWEQMRDRTCRPGPFVCCCCMPKCLDEAVSTSSSGGWRASVSVGRVVAEYLPVERADSEERKAFQADTGTVRLVGVGAEVGVSSGSAYDMPVTSNSTDAERQRTDVWTSRSVDDPA